MPNNLKMFQKRSRSGFCSSNGGFYWNSIWNRFALAWNAMENGSSRSIVMDTADLAPAEQQHQVTAEVDGQPLNAWATANKIGRSTAYSFLAIVKEHGIAPEKIKGSGTKALILLTGPVLQMMNRLLADHQRGLSLPELKRKYAAESSAIAPVVPTAIAAVPADDPAAGDPELLLKRLEAAAMAQATGLPLTKNEIQWILGAGINSEAASMARCRIEKRGRRWSLLPPAG
jgi:hypothetical protein